MTDVTYAIPFGPKKGRPMSDLNKLEAQLLRLALKFGIDSPRNAANVIAVIEHTYTIDPDDPDSN